MFFNNKPPLNAYIILKKMFPSASRTSFSPSHQVKQDDVDTLTNMGFKEDFARNALVKSKGDVGMAALELCEDPNAKYIPIP